MVKMKSSVLGIIYVNACDWECSAVASHNRGPARDLGPIIAYNIRPPTQTNPVLLQLF